MSPIKRKLKIGIIGCGAIGSRIAKSVKTDLKNDYVLSALYDVNEDTLKKLSKSPSLKKLIKSSITQTIKASDFLVETTNAVNVRTIIKEALAARKSVLSVNVGKLLNAQDLFRLAKRNNCRILLPSGAVAGIDTIKAASLINIKKIDLITRKPLKGLKDNPYLTKKGIEVTKIKKETILFSGKVDTAVKAFPKNINVAATLALACNNKNKLTIKIITSPAFKQNSHEINITGDFGQMTSITQNVICPDNPKSSYLAVLSSIQMLKQYCSGVYIGT
ncbi:aspartate dehydrogenase domain-containing protein [Candidatus Omnitrophota bacterium]